MLMGFYHALKALDLQEAFAVASKKHQPRAELLSERSIQSWLVPAVAIKSCSLIRFEFCILLMRSFGLPADRPPEVHHDGDTWAKGPS